MIVDSGLLIFDLSLKPSFSAQQAHFKNQQSSIVNQCKGARYSKKASPSQRHWVFNDSTQRNAFGVLSKQYWAGCPCPSWDVV
jgi:hypothetical protein